METLRDRQEHIRHMEMIAHKLLLVGRVLRLGCENAIDHFCGDDDKRFVKELENTDPYKVKEALLMELQQRSSRHHYSAIGFNAQCNNY